MSEEKMTNCPKCQKPVLNGGIFTAPARFNMKCPWCQTTLQIAVQTRIVAEIFGESAPAKKIDMLTQGIN